MGFAMVTNCIYLQSENKPKENMLISFNYLDGVGLIPFCWIIE